MTSSRRGVERADLDHHDWLEAPPRRARTGGDRRTAERRRGGGRAPAEERRSGERRVARRRSADPGSGAASVAPSASPGRARGGSGRSRKSSSSPAAPPGAGGRARAAGSGLGPGVAQRRTLMLVTFLLVAYGLVMAYSASAAEAYFEHGSSFHYLGRQILWVALGVGALVLLSRTDYAWFRKLAIPFAGLSLAGLVLVLAPGVSVPVNGARRWIFLGGQGVQPSELAKLACVVLVAALIVRRPREVLGLWGFLRLAVVGILPAAALIMLEPDMGTTLVLVAAVAAVFVAAGTPLRYLIGLAATGVVAVLLLIVTEPYRLERLVAFLDPWKDQQGSGYQVTQSLISIASGRVFGVGLGNSVQKFGFLPEQTTDMITGIIGEELGLVGLLVLLVLYAALAWVCFRIALDCKDLFGKLLAAGITGIVAGQACLNVGAAVGALPLTGVPLPLVSVGGTNLLVVLGCLGIMMNIATNRRSHIAVSAQRRDGAAGGRRDRRSPAAGARRRG